MKISELLKNLTAFIGKGKPKILALGAGLMLGAQECGASETIIIFIGALTGLVLAGHIIQDILTKKEPEK